MTDQCTIDDTTVETNSIDKHSEAAELPPFCCLTIVYHPQLERIGAQVRWPFVAGSGVDISRGSPEFVHPATARGGHPLSEARVSRSPVRFECTRTGVRVSADSGRTRLEVEGRPAADEEHFGLELLDSGLLFTVGHRVALMLHTAEEGGPGPDLGLRGASIAMSRLRASILRLAAHDLPVLLTGESGVGKELVAAALHASGPRAARKLISVNMAALPPSTAAVELFGHGRGAFTGARDARPGMFAAASGGTLFLDEIGEMPMEVQPMLLRAVEAQEIQPLGLSPRRVDTRIIAATDSDLEVLVRSGRFRHPLFQRLRASTIVVPPLRQRRVDIPLLFLHFLRDSLARLDATACLTLNRPNATPWLRLEDVLKLLGYAWPGNVRELRNVAHQVALNSHDRPSARVSHLLQAASSPARPHELGDLVQQLFAAPPGPAGTTPVTRSEHASGVHPSSPGARSRLPDDHRPFERGSGVQPPSPSGPRTDRPPPLRAPIGPSIAEVDEAILRRALEANDWRAGGAAQQLGLPRTTVYTLMERFGIRHAAILTREELEAALAEHPASLDHLAARLRVSSRGLRLRLHALGLDL
jgi:two-component system nitrogen regulation response regulator GlnG